MRIWNLSLAIAGFLLSARYVFAAINLVIYEDGSDLIMETDGGTLDLSDKEGWGFSFYREAGVNSPPAVWAGGTTLTLNNSWVASFTTVTYAGDPITGSFFDPDSIQTPGDFLGVSASGNEVFVPIPNSSVSISPSQITFNGTSLSDIGWATGSSGTWSWGSGTNADSITLTAVPEPRTYAALRGMAALGLVAVRRCRKYTCQRKRLGQFAGGDPVGRRKELGVAAGGVEDF